LPYRDSREQSRDRTQPYFRNGDSEIRLRTSTIIPMLAELKLLLALEVDVQIDTVLSDV
jgi:hypothetical protein